MGRLGPSSPFIILMAALIYLLTTTEAANGSCRYNGLGCTDDNSCWQLSSDTTTTSNNNNNSTSTPTNCKCCSGYPFYPGGECRSDCSRNVSLYLLNLWTTMAVGKEGQGGGGGGGAEHNNNVQHR